MPLAQVERVCSKPTEGDGQSQSSRPLITARPVVVQHFWKSTVTQAVDVVPHGAVGCVALPINSILLFPVEICYKDLPCSPWFFRDSHANFLCWISLLGNSLSLITINNSYAKIYLSCALFSQSLSKHLAESLLNLPIYTIRFLNLSPLSWLSSLSGTVHSLLCPPHVEDLQLAY